MKIKNPFPCAALALALSLGLCGPTPAIGATISVTPATLAANVARAADDTLIAAPGNYGALTIRKGHVILTGSSGAVFTSLNLLGPNTIVDGLRVAGIPDAMTTSATGFVRIASAANVTVKNLKITCGLSVVGVPQTADASVPRPGDNVIGLPTGRGVSVDRSPNAVVEGNDISQCHRGVVISNTDHGSILRNHIHDLRNTFIDGGNNPFLKVDGNHLEVSRPFHLGGQGDHGDFVHLWTVVANQTGPTEGVQVTNNLADQGTGAAIMGFYFDDNANKLGFKNLTVSGNVLITGNPQGLRLENASLSTVSENLFLAGPNGNYAKPPSIFLRPDVDRPSVKIFNNTIGDTYKTAKTFSGPNTIVGPAPPTAQALAAARARLALKP